MERMTLKKAQVFGWLAKMRMMRVLAMLLLALTMLPQQAAAGDYQAYYLPASYASWEQASMNLCLSMKAGPGWATLDVRLPRSAMHLPTWIRQTATS